MANIKITDLTAYTDAASTDVLPIVDVTANATKKIAIGDIVKAVPAGTGALPGLAFDGDPDTGLSSPDLNNLALSTGGIGRLFIDANGSVGIRESNPSSYSPLANNLVIRDSRAGISLISASSLNSSIFFGDTADTDRGYISYLHSTDSLEIGVNAVTQLVIDSAGDVRIIGGATSNSPAVLIDGSAPAQSLRVLSSGNITSTGTITADSFIPTSSTIPTNGVYLPSANNVAISSNGTGRLFISDDGKIGIGTSTPSAYSVLADDLVIAPSTASAGISLVASTGNYIFFSDLDAEGRGLITYQHGDDSLRFGTAGYERLYISSTGQIQSAGLGSAASPALSFTTDTNTGIYSPGADQVAISTGGSGKLFVNNAGEVDVSSANARLYVTTTGTNTAIATLRNASYYYNINLDGTGGALTFYNGTERLRITSDGKVGLGTSSPSDPLTVIGNTSGTMCTIQGSNTTSGYGLFVRAGGSDSGRYVATFQDASSNTRLHILSNGNVGVGTSSVDAKLHVETNSQGNIVEQLRLSNTAGGIDEGSYILFENANTAGYGSRIAGRRVGSGGHGLGFYTAATLTGTAEERLRIQPDGKVGVGTTSPSNRLTVIDRTTPIALKIGENNNATTEAGLEIQARNTANTSGYSLQIAVDANEAAATIDFNGSERARIDSSGRLLVGTSSTSVASTAVLQGRSGAPTEAAVLRLAIGLNNPVTDSSLGAIAFTDSGHTSAALVAAKRDGGTWTSGTSQPTRLEFSTTADGGSSPTERMRITNDGKVGVGTTTPSGILHAYSGTAANNVYINTATSAGYDAVLHINAGTATGETILNLGYGGDGDYAQIKRGSDNSLRFQNNNAERARITSSGQLLVGTSSDIGNESKIQLKDGNLNIYRASASAGAGYGIYFSTDGGATARPKAYIRVSQTAGNGGDLVFSTTADGASSPTERMRITNGGIVAIGSGATNTASVQTGVPQSFWVSVVGSTTNLPAEFYGSATTTRYHIAFSNPNGVVGSISTNASATSYTTSSDYRLKENVTAVTDGITRLQQLKPSRFNFIADPAKTVDGFIAHEVQSIVPEAITGEKDAVDDEGNPQYQGIDQSKLVPLLTAALQEAVAKIESLEARLTAAGI